MEKNARYTFRVNDEVRDKFKAYCKMMNISPSDILSEIMINFINDVDRIVEMQNINELQEMVQRKFARLQSEVNKVGEQHNFKS